VRSRELSVIASVDGRRGMATGAVHRSAVRPDQLEELVRAAEAATRDSEPAEDARPLPTPAEAPASQGWSEPPAETSISVFADFAQGLGRAFQAARSGGRRLYGYADHGLSTVYLGTSTGVRLRQEERTGRVELNGKSDSGSVWVGRSTQDYRDIDVAAIEQEVVRRLAWFRRAVDLPAGRYETILPPSAVADLLLYAYWNMSAREAVEGRTVFSRPNGRTRIGEQLSALPLTLRSDPHLPGIGCTPFVVASSSSSVTSVYDNGLALSPTTWIDAGRLSALHQTRHTASQTQSPVTPPIGNFALQVAGGGGDVDDLVARTEHGLLLTCLWYIREVDPTTLLLTGLTRDGVYLVEDGQVTAAVNNFRFNESPIGMLQRVNAASAADQALGREFGEYFPRVLAPALRVSEFNMSSVSQAS